MAYWNGANSLAYDTDGFYWDATNNRLGIGTNSPTALLSLEQNGTGGAVPLFPVIRVINTNVTAGDGTSTYNYADIQSRAGNGAVNGTLLAAYNTGGGLPTGVYLRTTTSNPLFLQTSAATRMTIDAAGYVGIGTITPTANLQVSGTFTVSTRRRRRRQASTSTAAATSASEQSRPTS